MSEDLGDLRASGRAQLRDALNGREVAQAALLSAQQAAAALAVAQRNLVTAEESLRAYLFEAAVSGSGSSAVGDDRRDQLAGTVREARARVQDLTQASQGHDRLRLEAASAAERVPHVHAAVVEQEAMRMAESFHHHADRALRSERAVQALADWAATTGGAPALASRLRAAVRAFPEATHDDPDRFQRAFNAHEDRMSALGGEWRAWAPRLLEDPDAAAPILEGVE